MSAYPYPHQQQAQQPTNPALLPYQRPGAAAINPAMLAHPPPAQHQAINPAQLFNPQSLMNMGSASAMPANPPMMNGAINPAMLAGPPHSTLPNYQPRPAVSPQELQMAQAKARQMQQYMAQQQQQQPMNYGQQQQPHPQYPSSYPTNMPPPQQLSARPPTSMSMRPPQRPLTASSSRPNTGSATQIPSPGQSHPATLPSGNGFGTPQMTRPPSRPPTAGSNHSGAVPSPSNTYGLPQQRQGSPPPGGFGAPQHMQQTHQTQAQYPLEPPQPGSSQSNGAQISPQHQMHDSQGSQVGSPSPYIGGMKRRAPSESPQMARPPSTVATPGIPNQSPMGMGPGMPPQAMRTPGPSQMGMGVNPALSGSMSGMMPPPPSLPRQPSSDQLHTSQQQNTSQPLSNPFSPSLYGNVNSSQQHMMGPGGAQGHEQSQISTPGYGSQHAMGMSSGPGMSGQWGGRGSEPPQVHVPIPGAMNQQLNGQSQMMNMNGPPNMNMNPTNMNINEPSRMNTMPPGYGVNPAALGNANGIGAISSGMAPSFGQAEQNHHHQQQLQQALQHQQAQRDQQQQHHHQANPRPPSSARGSIASPVVASPAVGGGAGMNPMGAGGMGMNMMGMSPAQIQMLQERKAMSMSAMAAIQQQQQQHVQHALPQQQTGQGPGSLPLSQTPVRSESTLGVATPSTNNVGGFGLGIGAVPQMLGPPMRQGPESLAQNASLSPNVSVSTSQVVQPSVPAPVAGPSVTDPSSSTIAQAQTSTLPPLSGPNYNPSYTRDTLVPLSQANKLIPPLSDEEIEDVKRWLENEKAYEGMFRDMKDRMQNELLNSDLGVNLGTTSKGKRKWWEKGANPIEDVGMGMGGAKRKQMFSLEMPYHVRAGAAAQVQQKRKLHGRREGLRLPGRLKGVDAEKPEQLVPIRLEFDVEHHKFRDTFIWNLNDPIVTPEIFAQSIVDDYGLMPSHHTIITKSIQEQLSDFKAHSTLLADSTDVNSGIPSAREDGSGSLESEEMLWWMSWRKRLRSSKGYVKTKSLLAAMDGGRSSGKKRRKILPRDVLRQVEEARMDLMNAGVGYMDVGDSELDDDRMHEEMRILVKLDITVNGIKLDDQFEWDIENQDPTPEQFAEVYSNDLGLIGEFKTAISHAIREQVQAYQKSLFLVGHPSDGSALQDDDLRMSFLPFVSSVTRPLDQTQAFTPALNYLSDSEIDRIDKEREKELNKRRKRNTRGRRGITLPDREPLKTHRTPAIGFPEIDPTLLALAVAAAPPTSRRAAAAAASVNIANMVASENGTAILPQVAPAAAPTPSMSMSKLPKPKGSFKAPVYSQEVLKARSKVKAPTASTSVDVLMLDPPFEGDPPLPPSAVPALPPDPKTAKILSARRQRELEKEAKEKEFVDGQHANMIDGVWHCSNCGCPDNIAIGRRKGPLGDKSQCGACGKYWHRHRRPRPIEYRPDAEYHLKLKADTERAKAPGKKRGRTTNNTQADQTPPSKTRPLDDDTPGPGPMQDSWMEEGPTKRNSDRTELLERPLSRASSVSSSASERPLAQTVLQVNGTGHNKPASSSNAPSETPSPPEPLPSAPVAASLPSASTSNMSNGLPPLPVRPQWLDNAVAELQVKWPDDVFEVILRKYNPAASSNTHEWRVKCLDCPGKLYTSGPGETLTNYEVHLKNRQHRAKVQARLAENS